MRLYKKRMPRVRSMILWIIVIIVLSFGGVSLYGYMTRDTNPIPIDIRSKLTFSPFIIATSPENNATSAYTFSMAENNIQIFSFIITTKNNSVITVSQYTQPQEFVEIPEYKDRFLSNVIKQYATVQTSNGTLYLGRLPLQNNKQLAVLIERGLIMFLSPNQDIEQASWRSIGDQFEIKKIRQ